MRNTIIFLIAITTLASCAMSMSPAQMNSTLPTMTQSQFISKAQADASVEAGKCRYLVRSRQYTAPIGLSVRDDVQYAARGIDEWVQLDGGNAYVLVNYNWVTVDHYGSTQLNVTFDTMICE